MVTTLTIERGSTAKWGTRTVFAAAVLMTLSAFAKETATVGIDLPKVNPTHTDAPASLSPTPVAAVAAPAVKVATRTRVSALATLTPRYGELVWQGAARAPHSERPAVRHV